MKAKEFANSQDINHIETDFRFVGDLLRNNNKSKANILFIPGIGCEYADHARFKDLLVSYNYYAINLPAHGQSLIESYEKLSLQDLTNYVLQFIAEKKLDTLVIIAHGTSCAILAQLNQLIPDKIVANILVSPIDTTFIADAREVRDILVPRIDEQIDQYLRLILNDWDSKSFTNSKWISYKNYKLKLFNKFYKAMNIMYDYFLDSSIENSLESLYSDMIIPTMVVYGQDDGLLRVEQSIENFKHLIPNVSLATIPLAGNMPFLENPNNYYSNVISFIDYIVDNYNEMLIEDEKENWEGE